MYKSLNKNSFHTTVELVLIKYYFFSTLGIQSVHSKLSISSLTVPGACSLQVLCTIFANLLLGILLMYSSALPMSSYDPVLNISVKIASVSCGYELIFSIHSQYFSLSQHLNCSNMYLVLDSTICNIGCSTALSIQGFVSHRVNKEQAVKEQLFVPSGHMREISQNISCILMKSQVLHELPSVNRNMNVISQWTSLLSNMKSEYINRYSVFIQLYNGPHGS